MERPGRREGRGSRVGGAALGGVRGAGQWGWYGLTTISTRWNSLRSE